MFGNDIEIPFPLPSPININNKSFILKKPLLATLKIIDNDSLEIVNEEFHLDVKGKDIAIMKDTISQQFFDYVMPYVEGKKVDFETRHFLSEYLDLDKYK